MRRPHLMSLLAIVSAVTLTAPTFANESTTHRITSGTFGVAWIASEGLMYTWSPADGAAPFRVGNLRAHQVAAIDYDGDGRDELAIIDAINKSLYVYDFDDQTIVGGYGNNVAEFTVGHFHPDESYESLVAATYSGHVFRWSKEIGGQGWIPLPGDFAKGFRGKVVPRIKSDALVTVARGDVYTLNPIWKTYSQVLLGKDARIAIACDLTASPGDEIVVASGDQGELLLVEGKTPQPLGANAKTLTCGKSAGSASVLIAVTPLGAITRYEPATKSWNDVPAEQTWSDAILYDADGDGVDELLAISARSPENLYRFQADTGSFTRLPHQRIDVWSEPSTIVASSTDSQLIVADDENISLAAGDRPVCDCKFWSVTHKPYIIRMYTPSGINILRDSPADHIHHHGLMLGISANECDFWAEFPDQPQGRQELTQLSFEAPSGTSRASKVTASMLWKNAEGVEVLQEKRTLEAIPCDAATLLTWSSELSKKPGQQVTLGGSHYFGLGMRFVESMDNDGLFRFSPDQKESTLVRGDERVTQASWAAYTAKLPNGNSATAAIFSHPENLRPMFAFTMGDNSPAFAFLSATINLYRETLTWTDDSVIRLRWGVAIWDGEASQESIDAAYRFWISQEPTTTR